MALPRKKTGATKPEKTENKPEIKVHAPKGGGDLLAELAGSAQEKKSTAKREEAWTLPMSPALQLATELFAASAVGKKVAEDQQKQDRAEVLGLAIAPFIEEWHERGTFPGSARLTTPNASCLLQVKNKVKVSIPEGATIAQSLEESGLSAAKAVQWAGYVEEVTVVSIPPLNDLVNSDKPAERAAGEALLQAIKQLPAEMIPVLLSRHTEYRVNGEKFFRDLGSNTADVEEMQQILNVLTPELALSGAQHNNALEAMRDRIAEAAEAQKG